MASGTIVGSVGQKQDAYRYYIDWWESDVDEYNNTSVVHANLYITCYKHNAYKNGCYQQLWIDGQEFTKSVNVNLSPGVNQFLISGEKTVEHNSDGSKQINISASSDLPNGNGYGPDSGSASEWIWLDTIPRYTTVYNSLRSRTLNTISINWSTTDARDWTQYRINDGAWNDAYDTVASDQKSGYYTISGLTPNTTYKIQTRCRRADSQLWSEASSISVTTYNHAKITEAPNFNDEQNPTIKYSNPFGSNVGELKACISFTGAKDDIAYRDVPKTGETYTFLLTEEERNVLRQKATESTLSVIFYLRTDYNGSSYYSTSTKILTIINANPIFKAFTYEDVNESTTRLTGNPQRIINGYSNVTATIDTTNKATAQKYAEMKRYLMKIGEKSEEASYSSSSSISIPLTGVSGNTVSVTAYDSRGNLTTVEYPLNPISYSAIKIASLSAEREGGVGTEVTLSFTAKYWNNSFGELPNQIKTCEYYYKPTNASSYIKGDTTLTYSSSGDTISGNISIKGDLGADGFNAFGAFNIQLVISDELTTAYGNIILGSGTPAIAIYEGNVAIGQKYDESTGGKLQVAGDTYVQGNLSVKGKTLVDLIYPVGAVYLSVNSTSPATLFGGTWEQIKGYYLYATNATSGTAGNKSTFSGTSTTAASGSTGSTAITVDQMPWHSHTGTTNNDGAHVHNSTAYGWMIDGVGNARQAVPEGSSGFGADILIRSSSSEHQHGFTTNGTGGGQGHTHSLNSHTHDVSYVGVFVWKRTA